MWWALVQSALPVFTGGFADRYGYKRQIVVAVLLKGAGLPHDGQPAGVLAVLCRLPGAGRGHRGLQAADPGDLCQDPDHPDLRGGLGLLLQVVNIGGFLGPPLAHFLGGYSWPMVFYGCAALVSLNLLWLLSYREVDSGADRTTGVWQVVVTTARHLANPDCSPSCSSPRSFGPCSCSSGTCCPISSWTGWTAPPWPGTCRSSCCPGTCPGAPSSPRSG